MGVTARVAWSAAKRIACDLRMNLELPGVFRSKPSRLEMLKASSDRLRDLPPDQRAKAEHIARTIIILQKQEDLISIEEATKIADDHRHERTEEWNRLVLGCALGLEALDRV